LTSLDAADELVTWINGPGEPATVLGVELEARKSFDFITPYLKGLTLGANITLIESTRQLSQVELDNKRSVDPDFPDSRPLYGQSPYIINLELNYDHAPSGWSFTVGANLTGERLVLVKTLGPDIYEHSPISLDAAISKRFWKYWTAKVGVRNILDPEFRRTYGPHYDAKIFQSYQRGRTLSLSLSADF
jgi:outer membrane receptor protein involved in Fe transport